MNIRIYKIHNICKFSIYKFNTFSTIGSNSLKGKKTVIKSYLKQQKKRPFYIELLRNLIQASKKMNCQNKGSPKDSYKFTNQPFLIKAYNNV